MSQPYTTNLEDTNPPRNAADSAGPTLPASLVRRGDPTRAPAGSRYSGPLPGGMFFIEHNSTRIGPGPGLPVSVDGASRNWEMVFRCEVLNPTGATILVAVQESLDDFVEDIRTIAVFDEIGQEGTRTVDALVRGSQRPSSRIGKAAGVQLRAVVQALTRHATANLSLLLISK